MSRRPGAKLDRAAEAMRLYLGGVGKVTLRDEQRLYHRVMKLVEAVSKETLLSYENVWRQLETEARRRGLVTPRPGQHL